MGEHQEWSKYSNYEVSTRVPLIFSVPWLTHETTHQGGKYPFVDILKKDNDWYNVSDFRYRKGKFTNKLAELVDLFPTLVDVAGLTKIPECPANSSQTMLCTEGLSLLPLLKENYPKGELMAWN